MCLYTSNKLLTTPTLTSTSFPLKCDKLSINVNSVLWEWFVVRRSTDLLLLIAAAAAASTQSWGTNLENLVSLYKTVLKILIELKCLNID